MACLIKNFDKSGYLCSDYQIGHVGTEFASTSFALSKITDGRFFRVFSKKRCFPRFVCISFSKSTYISPVQDLHMIQINESLISHAGGFEREGPRIMRYVSKATRKKSQNTFKSHDFHFSLATATNLTSIM